MAGTCAATRADGEPCRAPALRGGSRCYWHAPASREAMLEAAKRGGARRSIELPEAAPLDPERARAILAGVLQALLLGALDAGTARAAGYLLSIDKSIREASEIEARLAALEERAGLATASNTGRAAS